jgi:putative Holliday junction resolvase
MRLGALDVGEARIGLAVGEEGLPFAFGRGYLVRRSLEEDVEALLDFVRREGLSKLISRRAPRRGGSSPWWRP